MKFTYHTEFFPEAINHSSINFGNGIEEIQAKAAKKRGLTSQASAWNVT